MMYTDSIEQCIRDSEGRIVAWTVGMSEEEQNRFLDNHPGTYVSTARYDPEKGITL